MNVCSQNIINAKRPGQGIADLKEAGFQNVMLCPDVRFPYKGDKPEAEKYIKAYSPKNIAVRYGELVGKCRENGIGIPLMRAPYAYAEPDGPDIMGLLEMACVETMKLCRAAGCTKLIIEPPYRDTGDSRLQEANKDYYLRMAEEAGQYGITLLLRNQYKEIGGHFVRSVLSEPKRAAEYTDGLNAASGREIFGFCLDSGVCSICGNDVNALVTTLGSRIKAVILSDSDGSASSGMLPFSYAPGGVVRTDWLGLIRGLRTIGFDGELAVEFYGTRRAFPPMLSPEIFRLARLVGEYFQWQIQIERNLGKYQKIVLFGAGNMCRNYMKCYGGKYPPLFTCDNNPKLWGTVFEGIEVKNPEELRNLPADCGVFICNVYYREIEAQLREMGIENIEYFNDEYMPTFYFDRIEREDIG